MRQLVAAVGICAAAFLCTWAIFGEQGHRSCEFSPRKEPRRAEAPTYASAGLDVPDVRMASVPAAVATEAPFVVRDVREDLGWPAFDSWVPSITELSSASTTRWLPPFLSDRIDKVACQPNASPFFTYFQQDRPISELQSVQTLKNGAPLVHSDVSTCEFVGAMHAPLHGATEDVLADVLPLEHFIVREHTVEELFPKEVDAVKLMLWMGSNGTVTRMHYDWSHNFHILLSGRKRFRLYPPHDSWNLHLYPYLHPRATKSQLAFHSDGFPSSSLHPFDVVLNVGDVLYIPPLWHHEVTSQEPTVSLAVWSPAAETLLMNEVLTLGIPFTQSMMISQQSRANSLAVFLHMLLIGVERFGRPASELEFGEARFSVAEQSPGGVFRSLFESRFAPLRESVPELFQTAASSACPSLAWVTKSEESYALEHHFLEHVRDVFVPRFAFVPKQRRDVWMGDFIEITTNFVLGLPNVAPFLECMALWD